MCGPIRSSPSAASPPHLCRISVNRQPESVALHRTAIVIALGALSFAANTRDRRVVDTVVAGNAASERSHGYAGHEATSGVMDGKSYREARGWMRYAVTTFDDTEVTLVCTFAPAVMDSASGAREYDVLVEDSVIATKKFGARSAGASESATASPAAVVEIVVPFSLTKGRTNVAVMLRARNGSTPALRELRVVQDHNEQLEEQIDQPIEQQVERQLGIAPPHRAALSSHTPQAIR